MRCAARGGTFLTNQQPLVEKPFCFRPLGDENSTIFIIYYLLFIIYYFIKGSHLCVTAL